MCHKVRDIFSLLSINSNVTFYLVLQKKIENTKVLKGAIKQLYFLSTTDVIRPENVETSQCHGQDQTLLWKTYLSQIVGSKNVMLLLDHGGSLSRQQIRIVKAFGNSFLFKFFHFVLYFSFFTAKQIIEILKENDRVGVLAISDEWSSPYFSKDCVLPNQKPPKGELFNISYATEHNKDILFRFIDYLVKGTGEN